ncbi:MAG: hypothetical protein JO368_08160 [Acidimicrobiales bacterium]|nr:hypothetical protein [Acidimicrobiales bacterium]
MFRPAVSRPDKHENAVLYTAVYDDPAAARDALAAFEELHKAELIGRYDAAVIDEQDGKPHIVERADHPAIEVIPEWFGKGALPRRELHEAANELNSSEAALIVVGEPTLDKAFAKAVKKAARTVKRDVNAGTDELEKELLDAVKQ